MVYETSKADLGYIGETCVIAKLIRDYNIASVKVPQQFFPYDLITNNHKRLEVKTARPMLKQKPYKNKIYEWFVWQFTRKPRQIRRVDSCDFVVSVAFKPQDLSEKPRYFIIPSDKLVNPETHKPLEVWSIKKKPRTKGGIPRKSKYWKYEGKWDLIAEG